MNNIFEHLSNETSPSRQVIDTLLIESANVPRKLWCTGTEPLCDRIDFAFYDASIRGNGRALLREPLLALTPLVYWSGAPYPGDTLRTPYPPDGPWRYLDLTGASMAIASFPSSPEPTNKLRDTLRSVLYDLPPIFGDTINVALQSKGSEIVSQPVALVDVTADMLALVPAPRRSATRLAYGLDDGLPRTIREVAELMGIRRSLAAYHIRVAERKMYPMRLSYIARGCIRSAQ
jgi:hypothetical protein